MYLKETATTLPVDIDWDGNPIQAEFRFILQVEGDALIYGAQFPEGCVALGKSNQFTQGLWEASVVELFIHEVDSPKYIEINLSPTGAYWTAEFSHYRATPEELRLDPQIQTKTENGTVSVYLQINTKDITYDKFELAQTAVLKLANDNSREKIYLTRKYAQGQSAFEALDCEPDFHKKKLAEVL